MQDSLQVENQPTQHCGEHISGTTHASFYAKFKATRNKLGRKRHTHGVPKALCTLGYITKYR